MPTINQLVRKGRQTKSHKSKSPALQYTLNSEKQRRTRQPKGALRSAVFAPCPHDDYQETEFRPAENRSCASLQWLEVTAYIPGEGHQLQEHSVVLVRAAE